MPVLSYPRQEHSSLCSAEGAQPERTQGHRIRDLERAKHNSAVSPPPPGSVALRKIFPSQGPVSGRKRLYLDLYAPSSSYLCWPATLTL